MGTYYIDYVGRCRWKDADGNTISAENEHMDEEGAGLADPTEEYILCVAVWCNSTCSKAASPTNIRLVFAEDGSYPYTDVATGEKIQPGYNTVLTNGAEPPSLGIATGPTECANGHDPAGNDRGFEGVSPLQGSATISNKNYWIELQFAVEFSNCVPGNRYTFMLYDPDQATTLTNVVATEVYVMDTSAPLSVNVYDAVDAEESVTTENENLGGINVYSGVSLEDAPTVEVEAPLPLEMDVFDSVSVEEQVSVELPDALEVNAYDEVSTVDSPLAGNENLGGAQVNDATSVAEDITVEFAANEPVNINVYDSVSLTESKTVAGIPAYYITDFDEYADYPALNAEWDECWWNSWGAFTLVATGEVGIQAIRIAGTSGGLSYAVTWQDVAKVADIEILAHVKQDNTAENKTQIILRCDESQGTFSPDAYAAILQPTANELQLGVYDSSDSITPIASVSKSYDVDQWWWIRFRAEGTSLKVKAWTGGVQDEPDSWDIDEVDSTISSGGGVGGAQLGSGAGLIIDYFSVATYGGTAFGPTQASDSVSVSESVTVHMPAIIAEGDLDDWAMAEPVTEEPGEGDFEDWAMGAPVTAAEMQLGDPEPNVYESVSCVENFTVEMSAAPGGDITKSIYQEVTLSEYVSALVSELNVDTYDAVSVEGSISVESASALEVNLYDSVSAQEYAESYVVPPVVNISVYDEVSLDESVEINAVIESKLKWRLNVSANNGGSYLNVFEMQMRIVSEGADQCTGGIATASELFGFGINLPEDAFDDTVSTRWSTKNGTQTGWLEYEFTEPKDIVEYTIQCGTSNSTCNPNTWTLEYWDGYQWVIADSVYGETAWYSNDLRTFTVVDATEFYAYDTVSVSEDITLDVSDLNLNVFDLISTQDFDYESMSADPTAIRYVDVQDAVGISENVSSEVEIKLDVYQGVAVTEYVNGYAELKISVFDSLNVDESFSTKVSDLSVVVSDNVLAESIGYIGTGATLLVLVNDTVNVVESVTAIYGLPLSISVVDNLNVGESHDARVGSLNLYSYSSVTLADVPTLYQPFHNLVVSDTARVEENVSAAASSLSISVTDSVGVSDTSSADVGEAGPVDIPAQYDSVSVGESVAATVSDLSIEVDDEVALSEYGLASWIFATGYLRQEMVMYIPEGDCVLICPGADIELEVPDMEVEVL